LLGCHLAATYLIDFANVGSSLQRLLGPKYDPDLAQTFYDQSPIVSERWQAQSCR